MPVDERQIARHQLRSPDKMGGPESPTDASGVVPAPPQTMPKRTRPRAIPYSLHGSPVCRGLRPYLTYILPFCPFVC